MSDRVTRVSKNLPVLRAQVLLYVTSREMETGRVRPPSQAELMQGADGGMLNVFWHEQEIVRRYPTGFSSNSHISEAAKLLAEHGLMVPRGEHRARGDWTTARYRPTEEGREYARKHLSENPWTSWPDDFASEAGEG